MDVKGKNVFITGAAQGLGKAYAEAFLEKQAKVFFGDVNPTIGEATAKELGEKFGAANVRFVPFDVTDLSKFTEVFQQAVKELGHIDIMINNAGIMNEGVWEMMIKINVTAVVHGTKMATEHMRKDKGGHGGRIINISSIAGLVDFAALPVYCGTKHAVRSFTASMALQPNISELGIEYGIICPGAAATDLVHKLDKSKILFFDQVMPQIDATTMPISTVVDALMELVTREKMNGCMLRVEVSGKSYQKMESQNVDL